MEANIAYAKRNFWCSSYFIIITNVRASEVVQWVKALTTNPGDLHSIPRSYLGETENKLHPVF